MILSLALWLGGIVLFAVLAPTAFSVLPSRHLAGSLVGPMLGKLHWIGIFSGIAFLGSSFAYSRIGSGELQVFSARNLLVFLMLLLTLISQFGISSRMAALRVSMGEIDNVSASDPARIRFDALHGWSVRLEVGVLVIGLLALYRTAAKFG